MSHDLCPTLSRKGFALFAVLLMAPALCFGAGAPKAYIGLFQDNAVAVLDTASDAVVARIAVPKGPHGLAMSPDGSRVYVSSDGDSKVSVIDTGTDSIVASIEVGASPHGLALSPDGGTLLVAGFGTDSVVFVDTGSYSILGRVPVPSPHNVAISYDGATAYVAAQKKGQAGIAVLDVAGMSLRSTIAQSKAPRALGLDPEGRRLYFTLAGSDALQVYDLAEGRLVDEVAVGASPHQPLVTRDGRLALVVSQGPGELDLVDTATDSVLERVGVGTMPHWIALVGEGTQALVTNEGSNDLSVVDLGGPRVVATVKLGRGPRKIVVQPSTQAGDLAPARAEIRDFTFPDTIHAAVGQRVVWTNRDSVPHSVTGDDGGWDSGPIARGGSFEYAFDRAGSYAYHCSFHPMMTGLVQVEG